MKKYPITELRDIEYTLKKIRGEAVEQLFVARQETNLTKEIKAYEMVSAFDKVLKTLSHLKLNYSITHQLN